MDKSLMLDYDEVGNPILKDENGWTKIPLELTRICEWTPVAQASCTILNENSCKSNSNCTRTPPKNNIQINYSCVDDQDRKYPDSACAGIPKPTTSTTPSVPTTYSCIGTTPENASLIAGDNIGLSKNVTKALVSTNTSAKCEYRCNEGFELHQ